MQTMTQLSDAAQYYAELGYAVFPCVPGSKVPLTKHGHLDATADIAHVDAWWTAQANANIGIATEGLLVLDVDREATWLHEHPDEALELAMAPLSLTANGGRQYLFRQPAGKNWRNTTGKFAPHVDTRANGGYIVVPPSRLNGLKNYRWAEGMGLDVRPDHLPEPPPWLIERLDALSRGADTSPSVVTANAIPSGQRNDTLARLAGTMRRVGMSQTEIAAALRQANAERCRPPLPDREVAQIAASIARYEPDQISVAMVENHWGQHDEAVDDLPDEPEPSRDGDPGPIPAALLRIPGFINDVIDYTLSTAPYPDPVLAFGGALALQGLLAGRKVRDEADNRTNVYLLALANSGAGKDHPRKVNQKILFEIGLTDALGNGFASGEGIEDRMLAQPASLFQIDELDGLLLKVTQTKDARHEQVVSVLLQMYSSAASVYVMRAKAGRERTAIDQPCLCLFGTAVPKHFYESISPRLMTNGFLARMVILESRKRGRGQDAVVRPLPDAIVETARWWTEFQPGRAGNLSTWHPQPVLAKTDAEAAVVLRAFREQADAEYAQSETHGDPSAMAIWARAYEKARRLALVYACSAHHRAPAISGAAATWACAFVEHQTRRMLHMAGSHTFESDFDAKRKRLLEILSKWRDQHGDHWMPFWKINRKLPWSRREHDEIRDTLLSQRLIDRTTRQTGGRPGELYRLVPPGNGTATSASCEAQKPAGLISPESSAVAGD